MDTNDVQQRSRFIWTNITILNKDIKQFTNQNIYLHKIPKSSIGTRSKRVKDNKGKNNYDVLIRNKNTYYLPSDDDQTVWGPHDHFFNV